MIIGFLSSFKAQVMTREKVLSTYLLRFTKQEETQHIHLHDLKTGLKLEFETLVAAYAFLEQHMDNENKTGHIPKT